MTNEIKSRVIQLRKTLHLTQAKFGEKLGLSDVSICLIETGKNTLTEQNIRLICLTFGVNEVWLRTGKGEIFGISNAEKDEQELSAHFRALPSEERREMLKFARYLYYREYGHTLEEAYSGPGDPLDVIKTIFEAVDKREEAEEIVVTPKSDENQV